MTRVQEQLSAQFPEFDFKFDYILAPQTYFKIGGQAEVWVELAQKDQVQALVKFCHGEKIPVTILGGASNVVVSDQGVSGVVLRLVNNEMKLSPTGESATGQEVLKLRVGAGAKTSLVARYAIDQGLTGLEFFLGIPGTMGGAVYNNAHYLERLIGDYVTGVEVIDKQGESKWLDHDKCDFAYDHSRFHGSQEIIFEVEFGLRRGDKTEAEALVRKANSYRAQTQPLGEPSSGCIFRNVANTPELKNLFPQFKDRALVPAGFLIDQAGLKGSQVGPIEVSHKHAAFLINKGGGTSSQVKTMIHKIKETVQKKFNILLAEEIFYLE